MTTKAIKQTSVVTIFVAALVLLLVATIQSTAQASPRSQAANACVIPASGPWPPCATGGSTGQTGGSNSSCVIPESGPWPACATGDGTTSGGNSGGDCTIPASGPWPECARGGNTVPAPPPPPSQLCPLPNGQPGPWVPCGTGMPQPIVTPTPPAPEQPKLCAPPSGQGQWGLCDAGSGPAKVERFTAQIEPLGNGDDLIIFSWQTSGATSVRLLVGISDAWADHRIDLASSGSSSTVYESDALTRGQIGLQACRESQCDIQYVKVNFSCERAFFFRTNNFSPGSCPSENYRERKAVYQQFERGFVIWIEEWMIPYVGAEPAVLPFLEDATSGRFFYGFWPQADTWMPGEPISDTSLTPPAGMRQPTHGIGKIWRDTPEFREQFGWAVSAEIPFTAKTVHEVGLGVVGSVNSYLSLPDTNKVIMLSCGQRLSAGSCSWSVEDL